MNYKKIILCFFVFYLISILIFPIYCDTAMLQYDRNEYYETGTIAYNMEDMINSTHLYDFSLNNNHGNKSSGLTFTEGYFGQALTNFGATNNVTLPNMTLYKTDSYTIEMWVYSTAGGHSTIYKGFDIEIGNWDLTIWNNDYYYFRNGLDTLVSTVTVYLNQWVHIAVLHDMANSTHRVRMYFNGTLDKWASDTFRTRNLNGWLEIGCDLPYSAFKGIIDEFRIYKGVARTQTEIQQDMATSMAMKLVIEDLEANEDVVQLWYNASTLFEQQTANSEGKTEFNVYSFSNKSSEYQGIVNVYHEDIQYEGYIMVLYWGDIYKFTVVGLFGDLFTQLFFGTGAWLGILILILGSFFGLKLYKYSAVIFSMIFVLLGLQYYQLFSEGSSNFMWFFVFCWVMPLFLIFSMFKIKGR